MGGVETEQAGGEEAELEEDDPGRDGQNYRPAGADQLSLGHLAPDIDRANPLPRVLQAQSTLGGGRGGALHKYLLD